MNRPTFIRKDELQAEIEAGNVTINFHPIHKRLAILNYTKKAQFERHWNETTMRCRGLVVEWPIFGNKVPIVIDSPRKFFNNGEPEAPDLTKWSFDDLYISEKLDGYYISVRRYSKYGLIVTSRGSFDNKYVDAAKMLLPVSMANDTDYFCELCQDFPEDASIIVARHPVPRLVCWGVNKIIPTLDAPCGWTGEVAKEVTQEQFKQYMTSNVEGVVAFNTKNGQRVKVKTQWYLSMHRAISHCTFKDVLEIVMGKGIIKGETETEYTDWNGKKQTLTLSMIPEEHLAMMEKWEDEIWRYHAYLTLMASRDYDDWHEKGPKAYAQYETAEPSIKNIVFAMMRGKDYDKIDELTWKTVKNNLLRNPANKDVVVAS